MNIYIVWLRVLKQVLSAACIETSSIFSTTQSLEHHWVQTPPLTLQKLKQEINNYQFVSADLSLTKRFPS